MYDIARRDALRGTLEMVVGLAIVQPSRLLAAEQVPLAIKGCRE
jgi:hypothetical protein